MRQFLKVYFRACAAFFRTLFAPKMPIKKYSPNGHPILEGWTHSPEEKIIEKAIDARNFQKGRARLALYCYMGPHKGELLILDRNLETFGRDASNSKVITSDALEETTQYTIFQNGVSKLIAPSGQFFKVNGIEEQRSNLYDFDEIELLGNRFLALALESPAEGGRAHS